MLIRPFPIVGFLSCKLALAAAMTILAGPSFAAVSFSFLEQLPNYGQGTPRAINNAGQIVGLQFDTDLPFSAVVWQGTRITSNITAALDPLPGPVNNFAPSDINSSGVVSGRYITNPGRLTYQAATWDTNAGLHTLGLPAIGFLEPTALSINDAGHAVGLIPVGGSTPRATLWRDGTTTDLGTLGGASGIARSINNADAIVGRSSTLGDSYSHATLWQNGSIIDLGTLGGNFGEANDLNENGQIVGTSNTNDGASRATLWDNGAIVDLGSLSNDYSAAFAINEDGIVVGSSAGLATMWRSGVITDLNDFLPADLKAQGWFLAEASSINDKGWIVGLAFGPNDQSRAFLLTAAVPEPQHYLMMLIGLVALAAAVHRSGRDPGNVRQHRLVN